MSWFPIRRARALSQKQQELKCIIKKVIYKSFKIIELECSRKNQPVIYYSQKENENYQKYLN